MENKGDSIQVTDETAAAGKHSVKITDAPGLTNPWDPHLVYHPSRREGRVRNSFDLRVEQASHVSFEWRDWSGSPYITGPSFVIRDGRLILPGADPLDLPMDAWVHFEVQASLGKGAGDTWELAVTRSGQPLRVFKSLPFRKEAFKKLTWIGFTSSATTKTSFYLDNFVVE